MTKDPLPTPKPTWDEVLRVYQALDKTWAFSTDYGGAREGLAAALNVMEMTWPKLREYRSQG